MTGVIVAAVAPWSGVTPVRKYVNNSSFVHGTGEGLAWVSGGQIQLSTTAPE
jgi:hypothetical protein